MIRWLTFISAASFLAFLIRELVTGHPIVNLRILKNRNFTVGTFLVSVVGAILYGTTAALPIFLQTMLGYSALESGLALSPRGVGAFFTAILVGRLVGRVSNRWLIGIGFVLLAVSSFQMGNFNLQIAMPNVIWPGVINGIAITFIFVPLTTSAMSHLRQEQMGNATGVYNLMRNLGGSFGIALVATMLARRAQVHQAMMVSHLTPYDPTYQTFLASAQTFFSAQGDIVRAALQAQQLAYNILLNQARLWAFVEDFQLFGYLSLVCLPLLLLIKRVRARAHRGGGLE